MAGCCDDRACRTPALAAEQRRVLWIVLAINAVMFGVLLAAALWGKTISLFADSFDNFGDAVTYGISIWAVGRGVGAKAKVSLVKGFLILAAALAVTVQIVHKIRAPQIPVFEVMGAFSILALAANGACLAVLWKHRSDDLNMESVWHCSRNDIATNVSVFLGAGLVWLFNSGWPDVILACGLAVLLFRSAYQIIFKSVSALRSAC